ncbi:MAG: galactose mutarotase [Bacteroidaceae bacterium]|nr:galactose mutarotase [Bacteroidaceae bacterium]
MKRNMLIALSSLMLVACDGVQPSETLSGLQRENFVTEIGGKTTDLYVLNNANGVEACFTNHGARIVSVMVPDRDGVMRDVVLGFDSIEGYVNVATDFGAVVGRYANRIDRGRITLDSVEYQLPCNNYGHCLHGGPNGFQTQVFDVESVTDTTIVMTYLAADGEEGFPGNVLCRVAYTLTHDNAIAIQFSATTDKTTVVNLANHAYFNLDGDASKSNADYLFYINASGYTPVDSTLMTNGEILAVEGTPMDFRTPTAVGARINDDNEQLRYGMGYDHNWVLDTQGDMTQVAARLTSPATGIVLEVYTDQPGLQVYSGNFLNGTAIGKGNVPCNYRSAIVLETQKYPNSPNYPHWPSPVLRAGETYEAACVYKFSVEE